MIFYDGLELVLFLREYFGLSEGDRIVAAYLSGYLGNGVTTFSKSCFEGTLVKKCLLDITMCLPLHIFYFAFLQMF